MVTRIPGSAGATVDQEVRTVPATIIDYQDTAVEVHRLVVGPVDNNVYIVRCRSTGESVLIDAANEHDKLLDLCRALNVRQVVETHGHWDHIQAVEAVRDAGIDVAVTSADAAMLPSYDQILEDQSVLEVGRLRIATIATPGHTPGSMCFAVEGTPAPVLRGHPVPGRAGQHLVRALRLRHHHRVHRGPAVRRLRSRHPGPARPRCRHHHRRRVTPPRRVGRPGLVSAGAAWPAQTAVDGRRGSRTSSISGGSPLTATPPGTSVPTSMVTRDPASGIPSTLR